MKSITVNGEEYFLLKDVQQTMKQLKYPQFADGVFSAMVKMNKNLEEIIRMMEVRKEGEGCLWLEPCVMVRFADNINRIKELTKPEEKI